MRLRGGELSFSCLAVSVHRQSNAVVTRHSNKDRTPSSDSATHSIKKKKGATHVRPPLPKSNSCLFWAFCSIITLSLFLILKFIHLTPLKWAKFALKISMRFFIIKWSNVSYENMVVYEFITLTRHTFL